MTDSIHIPKHRKTKLGLFLPSLLKNYAQIENLEGLPLHQVIGSLEHVWMPIDHPAELQAQFIFSHMNKYSKKQAC